MKKIKYIILDNDWHGLRPFLFSDQDQHCDVAFALKHSKDEIVGAGFVEFVDGVAHCYGRSESLNVDSRPELDSKIVNKAFGLGVLDI